MKDAYYFKHDSNARNDIKIKRLIKIHGIEGYGKYWILVEMLREQDNYKLSLNSTKYPYAEIADELRCTEEDAKHFITDCIEEFHLLETDGQYLWSNSLLRRMAPWDEFRKKQSQKAHKRWSKKQGGATAKPRHSRGNASIVKDSIVKESIYGQKSGSNDPIDPSFDPFWLLYPRKVKKKDAYKIWLKLNPDESLIKEIMDSLRRHINSAEWQKEKGKYIPHPTTFLNQERWKDEIEEGDISCLEW